METMTAKATVVNRDDKAPGVDLERAKNSVSVLSTREWTDNRGVTHPAAPSQAKQPVSISYSVIEKSDSTKVELITVRFKTTGVAIRAFSGDFAHLLVASKKNPKLGVITASELSYDARTVRFSTDEVEAGDDEDSDEASA